MNVIMNKSEGTIEVGFAFSGLHAEPKNWKSAEHRWMNTDGFSHMLLCGLHYWWFPVCQGRSARCIGLLKVNNGEHEAVSVHHRWLVACSYLGTYLCTAPAACAALCATLFAKLVNELICGPLFPDCVCGRKQWGQSCREMNLFTIHRSNRPTKIRSGCPAERVGTDPVINTAALLTHRKSGPDC